MGTFNYQHAGRFRRTGSIGAIFITACMYLAVPSPVRVRANVSISAVDPTDRIAAGDKHTCAIALDDIIWCWGDNTYSQLGSSAFPDEFSAVPIQITALPGSRIARRIVAGANHTCVLATDGTVWCWGQNGNGNLGDGSFLNQGDPVQAVLGGAGTMIAAGGASTCAVLSDSSLQCWGRNNKGQLGNGTSGSTGVTTPVYASLVPASFTVAHLEIGSAHSCAISVAGAAWCWGDFNDGRLGTTGLSNAVTPTATASLGSTASEIAAGGAHTCALLSTGGVSCFGSNDTGQLGQLIATASSSTPTLVTLEATASHVSAGKQFTCALLSTAVVHCFGDNATGQLGSGSIGSVRETSGAVVGLTGTVVDVVAGTSHACAVMSTGQVRCWGLNDQGQLGIGTKTNSATATAIASLNVVPTTTTTTTAAPIIVEPTTTTTAAPVIVEPTTTTTTVAPSPAAPLITEPTSTTTSTTNVTTSITVVQSTTTTGLTTAPAITSTTALITSTVAVVVAKAKAVVVIHPMAMRQGSKVSAAKLAASVSMSIPKKSVGTMRISITRGTKYCAFFGTSLKAVRKGKCTIVVILLPKKGKTVMRTNTLTVRK